MIPTHLKQKIESELTLTPPVKMEGWTTPERGIEMAELVLETKPEIIVEIGCFGARSTVAMGLALKELGKGHLYTIDPWKKEAALEGENQANQEWWNSVNLHDIHRGAMESIWRNGLDEYVTVIRNYSHNVANLFGDIGLLFLDGNHSEIASCRDVENFAFKSEVVWFDDTDWPSTAKALSMMKKFFLPIKDNKSYQIFKRLPIYA